MRRLTSSGQCLVGPGGNQDINRRRRFAWRGLQSAAAILGMAFWEI